MLHKYLNLHENQRRIKNSSNHDVVRKISENNFKIGNSKIIFFNDCIQIKNQKFPLTHGLLELLFQEQPDDNVVTENDLEKYGKIVSITTRKLYQRNRTSTSRQKSKASLSLKKTVWYGYSTFYDKSTSGEH